MSAHTSTSAWASGSDRPEKEVVRIGFLPLTDCAPLVMAALLGFDRKYGIRIELRREASWSALRDKLVSGELDAAQALYGLVYGVHLGIGSQQAPMAVLMNLNQNGQAITLSQQLAARGAHDGESLARLMRAEPRNFVFAQTFPTGTHAMWLYYWLAAHGIDPLREARAVTVAPSQMVASLRAGQIDGFCAGEPYGQRAVADGVGITAATSQQIWQDHPEKVLGASAQFVQAHPHTCRAMIAAILEACRWIDASAANQRQAAEALAGPAYLACPRALIEARLLGHYQNGLGRTWDDPSSVRFYHEGAVNVPWLSDGMWFLTQFRRWGLLRSDPDYLAVAGAVQQRALYGEAAALTGTALPASPMRASTLIDGVRWDGSAPGAYAAGFPIGHASPLAA